ELDRLAVATVVAVGGVAPLPGEGDDASGRTVVRSDATADALSALTGSTLAAPAADPAAFTSGIAAYVPAPASPSSDLPEVTSAAPLTDVVALAVDGSEQLAPVAT